MAFVTSNDGVRLHFVEWGSGEPIVFVHEFAGDVRSWNAQISYFTRRYRCIAFNARGYPPSDVPLRDEQYSQDLAREDITAVLDHLGLERAHLIGHSMGAFAALHFALHHPSRTRSAVLAGCGYGAHPDQRAPFRDMATAIAEMFRADGMAEGGRNYATFPGRMSFHDTDPRGYEEFRDMLCEHSAEGCALTMLNVQRLRPSLWDLEADLKALHVPILVVAGDEDHPCVDAGVFLKRTLANAGLAVIANCGHTVNSEEPARFNAIVDDFLTRAEADRWRANAA
jgi:pimeloyl-ACP methyl ester carboxylesterase